MEEAKIYEVEDEVGPCSGGSMQSLEDARIDGVDKPGQCNQCSQFFTAPGVLKRHMLIHSGVKPHPCKPCPQAFTLAGNLKAHITIHSGEKPYKCKQCPKSFTESGKLKRHMLIHSGEKPYKCKQCPKSFTKSGHTVAVPEVASSHIQLNRPFNIGLNCI